MTELDPDLEEFHASARKHGLRRARLFALVTGALVPAGLALRAVSAAYNVRAARVGLWVGWSTYGEWIGTAVAGVAGLAFLAVLATLVTSIARRTGAR
jgi:hypothetical protein